jgi:hypothetical protein
LISRNVIALTHSVSLSVSELLEFKQLDFCHHNLVCLIIMKYSNTWVGQWRNYYGFGPGEPGGPQPQWAKWGPPCRLRLWSKNIGQGL